MNATTENNRILVVDDNSAIHDDFRKIIGGAAAEGSGLDAAAADLFSESTHSSKGGDLGFELSSAYQGQQALEMVTTAAQDQRPFAVAFVDVRMPPGWDGVTTVGRLWEVDPHLQVVICTAYSDYSWDEMLKELGVTDRLLILKKPFDNIEVRQLACSLTKKWNFGRQARSALEELQATVTARTAELQGVLDTAMDGILTIDDKGIIQSCNPASAAVFARPCEALVGHPLAELLDDDFRLELAAFLSAAHAKRRDECPASRREVVGRRADGTPVSLDLAITLFHLADRRLFTVILRDMTEQKSLQSRLLQAEKLQSIGQLAAGVAHEINTPTQFMGDNIRFLRDSFQQMDVLLTSCEKLVNCADDEAESLLAELRQAGRPVELGYLRGEIPVAIEQSLDGVETIARIVRAMKEFSHPGTTQKSSYDINRAILNTLTVVQSRTKDVADVRTVLDETLPLVECLPNEVNQVLLNIIVNAADAIAEKHGPERGNIAIRTRRDGPNVEIAIEDDGGGIPPRIQNRVFDPFFTTKDVGKGTGQGLSIAHSMVVDKHHGELTFDSTPGVGSTFFVRLPILAPRTQPVDELCESTA
jgi:PAS domain S-box-containing protein